MSTNTSSQTPLVSVGAGRVANGLGGAGNAPSLFFCVSIACVCTVLYGFHMSELNAPSALVKAHLGITDAEFGLATSLFSLGGFVGSSLASELSNRRGLRLSFMVTLCLNCVGSLVEARAKTLGQLLLGRVVSGSSGGLAIVLVPLYVNAVSPPLLRGTLGSMTQVSVNIGILAAQIAAMFLADDSRWRVILHLGWVLGLLGLILCYAYLQESPRWLAQVGRTSGATEALMALRGGSIEVALEEMEAWKRDAGTTCNLGFYDYLSKKEYIRSKTIATVAMVGQQLSGINAVIFYGVSILNGLFPTWSVTINCGISVANMVVTGVASVFLDRLGRKPMLQASLIGMALACVGLAWGISSDAGPLTVVSIFVYVGSFAVGCGPIPFLLISEVTQTEARPVAQSWATNCNWASVFLVGFLFPIFKDLLGSVVYLLFGAVSIAFALFVAYYIPETMGKSTYAAVWEEPERDP